MTLSTDDIVEIQQLAARYCHAVDAGDGPSFAATFTPDGSLSAAGQKYAGRENLATFATGVPLGVPGIRHALSNIWIGGDESQASLRAYMSVSARVGPEGSRVEVSTGKYDDTLIRVDGQWLFAERVFTSD
jgi:uncharacterized protein (TIGR02246 family)